MMLFIALAYGAPVPPEVVVLGVAQDGGHPQAGCTKACCEAAWADSSKRHHVASLGIVDGERFWVIDATPDFAFQHRRLSLEGKSLAGVFLTHAHMGHYTGLLQLGREVMGASQVPVYGMPRLKTLLATHEPWALLSRLGNVTLKALTANTAVRLSDNLTVVPFLVPHRDELSETVGFKVVGPNHTVAWIPDIDKWERWDVPLEQFLSTVDRAYVDGTFFADGELERDMSAILHPHVADTMARLAPQPPPVREKVRFVHLNHTNPALDPATDAAKSVIQRGFAVAVEGERYAL